MLALGLTNVENKEDFKVDKTWKQIENLLFDCLLYGPIL